MAKQYFSRFFKSIKFICIELIKNMWLDLRSLWDNMGRPKEIMNILFYLAIIFALTGKTKMLPYVLLFSLVVYIFRIVVDGKWKNMMREKEIERLKEKKIN
jgi:hypothetical protein